MMNNKCLENIEKYVYKLAKALKHRITSEANETVLQILTTYQWNLYKYA